MSKSIHDLALGLKIQGATLHISLHREMRLLNREIGEVTVYAPNKFSEMRDVSSRPFFEKDQITDYQFEQLLGTR